MKIYTRTGDDGTTGLLGRGRVEKSDPRIEAYGTVDELNAVLGCARGVGLEARADALLDRIQGELFLVGAALADPDPRGRYHNGVGLELAAALEADIDELERGLPSLTQFILPGGSRGSGFLHLARTVCRRAERRIVELRDVPDEHVSGNLIIYLNRLGDFLFTLARWVNQSEGVQDVVWRG